MITRAKSGISKPKIFNVLLPTCDSLTEPSTVLQALSNPDWKSTMDSEFQALVYNNTWTLVPFSSGMNVVNNKQVFQTKYKADGSLDKLKARLVAKGFQQTPGLDYFDMCSPVIKPTTIRVVFTLAVTNQWDIQ